MTDISRWTEDAILAATVIPRVQLRAELELTEIKWPNYRFLTPAQATRLFKDAYLSGYRSYHARNIDRDEAQVLQIGNQLDLRYPSAHNTQLWRARQFADSLGMPYGPYMEFVFGFAEARKRRYAPQPNQLGPSLKSEAAWQAKLMDFWTLERAQLELSRSEPLAEYRLGNDIGLVAQANFRADLIALAAGGVGSLVDFLEHRVVTLEQLSRAECSSALPGSDWAFKTLDDRLGRGLIKGHAYPTIDPGQIRPSCFGLPGIESATESRCLACPRQIDCTAFREGIHRHLQSSFGSADPIAEKRRAGNAERQRRYRANKNGIVTPSSAPPRNWQSEVKEALSRRAPQPTNPRAARIEKPA